MMKTLFFAASLILGLLLPPRAFAQLQAPVMVEAGSGRMVTLPSAATSVFAADPKVLEVRPASPTSLFVFGVGPGHTTVAATSATGHTVAQFEVTVRPSSYSAGEAGTAIRTTLPSRPVTVAPRGNGLSLSGQVADPAEAEQAMAIAKGFLGEHQEIDNRLRVRSSIQVNLRVRVAEMSRNLTRNLGVNWQALGTIGSIGAFPALNFAANSATLIPCTVGGASSNIVGVPLSTPCQGGNFNALIDALSQDELVHVLAEPNLTAISGETASFLVGGEFPIPVGQENGQVTIEFKQYGISLAFVPTVLGDSRISLHVRPEVSQLSTQGAVRLQAGNSSLVIPALTVRRAETTVELASGQSFAIAGLMSDSTQVAGSGLPIVGDLPVLGALFRSDAFQRNETELVIVVTPYVVNPVSDPSALKLPTDGWHPPSDLERILLLRQKALGTTPATPPTIPGNAGFIIQ
jgi:pilus assembly protein CpaC